MSKHFVEEDAQGAKDAEMYEFYDANILCAPLRSWV